MNDDFIGEVQKYTLVNKVKTSVVKKKQASQDPSLRR